MKTGNTTTASGVKTSQGSAASVGNHTVATHDGDVYKSNGSGGWDQVTKPTQKPSSSPSGSQFERPTSAPSAQQKSSFENEAKSRDTGAQRARSFQGNRPSLGGGCGGRRR